MKQKLMIAVLLLSLGATPAGAQTGMVKILVTGVVCAFCSQGLTRVFSQESAVEKVDVNLDNKTVYLQMKKGQDIPNAKLQTIIEDLGFNVVKIDR